ncbi:MAG: MFS transporter [Verrucomicrobiota bacterium]
MKFFKSKVPEKDRVTFCRRSPMGSGPVEGTAIWIPQGNLTPVFNIAMDMNPALLGIVLTLWRICDVVADQVMGNISDNARTRWGRRKPRSTRIKSAPDFLPAGLDKKNPADRFRNCRGCFGEC